MQYFYHYIKAQKKMDLFQTLKSQAHTQSITQKSKKIYLFNRRKFSNSNQKKLNELVHLHQDTPQKYNQSFLDTSIMKYMSQQPKASRMVTLNYKEDEHEAQLRQKRREITNKIISNFHISGFRIKQNNQAQKNKQKAKSQLYTQKRSISEPSQFSLSLNYLTVTKKYQHSFQTNPKNNSLPHLDKRSISITEIPSTLSKPRKFHSPLGNYSSFHDDDIYFLKTGAVSGQKIYNSRTKLDEAQTQQKQHPELTKLNSRSEPDPLAERYYSLIRKTDYRKMTNYAGKKIIRNSFLSVKQKTNSSKQSFQITNLHGKSLIKLQQILSNTTNRNVKI